MNGIRLQRRKSCLNCCEPLYRKRFGNRLEDLGIFLKRKYCSMYCFQQLRLKNSTSISTSRRHARMQLKLRCEKCGTKKGLDIHHKDRNPLNNAPRNLQTLCASCHTKLHWQEGKKGQSKKFSGGCQICGRLIKLRLGMCPMHYQRFKKYGDPNLTKKKTGRFSFGLAEST